MPPHTPLPENVSFPELEEKVLERWRELDVYNESLKRREGAPPYVFYEGPPTANGKPGSHHVLARVFKDVFPRYKTMRGFYSYRKGGWDCHGLPVEIAVQQQLGIENKAQIEEYGIAEFNAKCRESVFEFLEDWTKLTERIGYWVDLDDPYRTLDAKYVESVWWALSQLWQKDLLYEGFKVVPYCPKDGTALSSHEVSQGYQDVEDPSVFIRYPVNKPHGVLREGDELLVWTTTPWTLVSNAAVAVDPELTYVRTSNGEVLAEALVTRVIGEDATVADRFKGADMVGAGYEPPFPYIPASEYGEKGHTVLPADFVSAEDGTGIVHTAIAFGEDDFRLGAEQGLAVINPVRGDGTYDERIGPYAGRFVKDADNDLIEDLRGRGRLFRAERLLHAYPHCWRCGTPLLYYAKPSWYIKTSQLRDRLLAANESVDWHPEHIKHGRMGRWLENNVDWALSRERYWGTPLPIWRNEAGETVCVGSFARAGGAVGRQARGPAPPVRGRRGDPVADRRRAAQARPRGDRRLVRLRLDAVRPVARAVREPGQVRRAVPRGLHLRGHRPDARLVLQRCWRSARCCSTRARTRRASASGTSPTEQGKKMSKSLGNIVVPWDVIDRHGADAFRWYFLATKLPWEGYNFDTDTVGESLRQFLLQLWNTYGFYVLYANVNDVAPSDVAARQRPGPLGRSRGCAATVETVDRPARALRRHARRARRSRPSSTISRTGTCAARVAGSGTATRPAFATLRTASSR